MALVCFSGLSASATTVPSGTYIFDFTATLTSERFDRVFHDCTGVYAASVQCAADPSRTFSNLTYNTQAGFDALDAAGIDSPMASLRGGPVAGRLILSYDSSEFTDFGDRVSFGPLNTQITCAIGTINCGFTRFLTNLSFTRTAQDSLLPDIRYTYFGWGAEFDSTRYFTGHDAGVADIGEGYFAAVALSDFTLLRAPDAFGGPAAVPLPGALAFWLSALGAFGLLRRRQVALRSG